MEMCRYICIYRYRYYIIIGMYYGLIDAMFYKQGVSMLFTHCPGTAILHVGEVVARIPPNDYSKPVAEKSASALMDLHKPKAEHKVVRVKN